MLEKMDSSDKLHFESEQEDQLIENPIIRVRHSRQQSFRKTKFRWLGLFFQCFLLSGQKYCFDNPQALQSSLTSPAFLNLSSAQYNLFYSFYSSSNVIIPLFGGLLIDKLSIRIALFLFSSTIIIGQTIFMIGGAQLNYTLMLIGRLIFGLGGECMAVTQTSSIARWFKNKDLALALSLALGCNRMGSLANSSLTPYLFSTSQNYLLPLGVGLGFCVFSWICGMALNYMDRVSDAREGKIFASNEEINEGGVCIKFKDVFEFKPIYWLIVSVLALSYGSLLTFTGNANDLLSRVFYMTNQMAGNYITLIYLISAICLPFVGCFIDSKGKRTLVMFFSLIFFLLTHIFLVSYDQNASKTRLIVPMVCCGIFYACFGGFIWNSIALVVRDDQLGIAYGVAYAFININLVVSPLIYGFIHDSTREIEFGYFWAETFIIVQICFCLILGMMVFWMDWREDKKLWRKIERREIFESMQKNATKSYMSFG